MTISIHKLGIVSVATKFIPGSTSNQQLAVKISDKNSKACIHENTQNKSCLNKDEFAQIKIQQLCGSKFYRAV